MGAGRAGTVRSAPEMAVAALRQQFGGHAVPSADRQVPVDHLPQHPWHQAPLPERVKVGVHGASG
jgi:hypothetical protein